MIAVPITLAQPLPSRRSGARPVAALLALLLAVGLSAPAIAQNVLIRNATVHTVGPQGSLPGADVLVEAGIIRTVGQGLVAPDGVLVVEADGRPLTPGLFAGLTGIGIEEVSAEPSGNDGALSYPAPLMPQMRPEFDVATAYNPRSTLLPIARRGGLSWTVLAAGSGEGGSIVAGQGAAVRLDGGFDAPYGQSSALFVNLGGRLAPLSGNSRAAQYMLLEQAFAEARGAVPVHLPSNLLTPAGRGALARQLDVGRLVVSVDRAADIRRVLALAERERFSLVLSGAAEGWLLADRIAAAGVPVLIDSLANLPVSFDAIAARLDAAARLHAAGVKVGFSQSGDASHNARKVRQLAGNAVANGLPWEAGLAGLTRVPAEAFGLGAQLGSIEVGKQADLVLWSGDPLEVNTMAERMWLAGVERPLVSRQTELRDRYLRPEGRLPRAYPAR